MFWRTPEIHPGLMVDLYHPDSAYVSWKTGRNGLTAFDLYTRTIPFGDACSQPAIQSRWFSSAGPGRQQSTDADEQVIYPKVKREGTVSF